MDSASPCHPPSIDHAAKEKSLSVKSGSQYSSTHLDESSSDEEDGLRREGEETWEMISI